jgi:ADP-ribosylglycohydrolase
VDDTLALWARASGCEVLPASQRAQFVTAFDADSSDLYCVSLVAPAPACATAVVRCSFNGAAAVCVLLGGRFD